MERKLPRSINNATKKEQLSQQADSFIDWINSDLRQAFESEGLIFDLATIEKYSDIQVLYFKDKK